MHQKVRHVLHASLDVAAGTKKPRMDVSSAVFKALKAAVLDAERRVMYTLEFDIAVEQPYPLVKSFLLGLKDAGVFAGLDWGRGAANRAAPKMVTEANLRAHNIAFESCGSDLCLRFTPSEIAAGCLEAAFEGWCVPRGIVSPVSAQALLRVVAQPAGAGSGGASSSSAGRAALGGAAVVPPVRACEAWAMRDFGSRYSRQVEEDAAAAEEPPPPPAGTKRGREGEEACEEGPEASEGGKRGQGHTSQASNTSLEPGEERT